MIEDAGTPAIMQFIRASLAYNLRNEIGLETIRIIEEGLKFYFGSRVRSIEGVKFVLQIFSRKASYLFT